MEKLDAHRYELMKKKIKITDSTKDCWNWEGNVNASGRPVFTIDIKKKDFRQVQTIYPQTVLYEVWYNTEKPARVMDLSCGNSRCCNPTHMVARTFNVRFWENTDRPDGDGGCWLWKGYIRKNGYGSVTIKGKSYHTHVVSYKEYYNEEIPKGMCVLHSCNNPACINPAHLRLGTHQDNMDDMTNADRQAKGSKNGNSVLNEDQVRQIKILLKNGATKRSVAEAFGVSFNAIKDLKKGRTWKWLKVEDNDENL